MRQLHPIGRCLRYPPLPGKYGPLSLELEVCDRVRIFDQHNAQLVVVEILTADPQVKGLSQGQRVAAKLYDPMYIDDDDFTIDPFLDANEAYAHEVAAYEALSGFQGSMIPQYYGSYSLELPIEPAKTRSVRLILIELIHGSSLMNCNSPQPAVQKIMKSLIEIETSVYARNIRLRDAHPRNVIVTKHADGQTRAVFIDFGKMEFDSGARAAQGRYSSFQLPSDNYVSPLLRWHNANKLNSAFNYKIHWDWQPWLEAEFSQTAASITPGMQEFFLSDFWLKMWEESRQKYCIGPILC